MRAGKSCSVLGLTRTTNYSYATSQEGSIDQAPESVELIPKDTAPRRIISFPPAVYGG